MVREQEVMDVRIVTAIEELEGQRDALLRLEGETARLLKLVLSPTLSGVAAGLREGGEDGYAKRLEEVAAEVDAVSSRMTSSCRRTRLLIEHLSTLTDARLETTRPRLVMPPKDPESG